MDAHSVAYHHMRRFLRDREDWLVRCGPKIAGVRPDLVVFNRYTPKFVLELGFCLLPDKSNFARTKAEGDRDKLHHLRGRVDTLGKGYLLMVHDSGFDESLKTGDEWEKYFYRELFIDAQSFRGYERWKHDWAVTKSNQMDA
jgi:hypothetical protein